MVGTARVTTLEGATRSRQARMVRGLFTEGVMNVSNVVQGMQALCQVTEELLLCQKNRCV
jgi:hypothetical protein